MIDTSEAKQANSQSDNRCRYEHKPRDGRNALDERLNVGHFEVQAVEDTSVRCPSEDPALLVGLGRDIWTTTFLVMSR